MTEQSIASYGRTHHLTLPNIEYVLWAIIFGLVVANTVGIPAIFRAGVDTYEFWLKAGIVLLGVRFLLGDVVKLGGVSLACVAIELVAAIILMTALGRAFGLSPKLISLLSIGSSICGVSAIIAAKGAIDADDEDASYAMAAILALGAVSLFVFPLIGRSLGMSDNAYGLWVGLAVDNTAEATAAGALFSDAAGKFAVLAKTARNATIGFVVLGYALYWVKRNQGKAIGNKAAFLWQKFPKFVLGFLVISAMATAGAFYEGADDRPGEPVALGVPADVRGSGPADERARADEAGLAPAGRRRGGGVRDRGAHAGDGSSRRQEVLPVAAGFSRPFVRLKADATSGCGTPDTPAGHTADRARGSIGGPALRRGSFRASATSCRSSGPACSADRRAAPRSA